MIRAAALIALLATPVSADLKPDAVSILGASYHSVRTGYVTPDGDRQPWNEFNPGIALTWDIDPVHSVTAAAFLNSYDSFGAAVVVDQVWLRGDNWSTGIYAGLGYYPTYGSYQVSSLGHVDDRLDDAFIVGGLMARVGNIEVRHMPAQKPSVAYTSLSLTFDLGPRGDGSIGQTVWQSF